MPTTYSSSILLQQLQQQAESLLETAIADWQMTAHKDFARQPAPQSWSANECLQHLNSYSRYYLPAIEKEIAKASKSSPDPIFHPGWLGNYFTKLMMPGSGSPVKKMKAPKDHAPASIIESHLVIAEFIEHQEKFISLLQDSASVDLNSTRIPISISKMIRLKLGDTFRFLMAHQQRHFLQAQRALGAATTRPDEILTL